MRKAGLSIPLPEAAARLPGPCHIEIFNLGIAGRSRASMVALLAEEWRRAGYRVSIATNSHLGADIGIINFDKTRVELSELPANPKGRPLLNASFLDISKRRISRYLLEREDKFQGPVIVKTNLNYSGLPEWILSQPGTLARMQRRVAQWIGGTIQGGDYPIYTRADQVPDWVWRDRSLVVERLLCERDGDLYVLRMWVFFGSGEYVLKFFSRQPVVKFADVVRMEFSADPVPEQLRAMRRELQADFGKFDFTIIDGVPHLLDANKSPVLTHALRGTPEIRRVALGIRDWAGSSAEHCC